MREPATAYLGTKIPTTLLRPRERIPVAERSGGQTREVPLPDLPSARPAHNIPWRKTQIRLSSLDALRGFVMFWIIGGDDIARAVSTLSPNQAVKAVCEQFSEHASWVGFRFYDLILPLFLFIIGATLPFSVGRHLEDGLPRGAVVRKILIRTAILFGLGLIYNGALHAPDWDHVRIFGVLQRLAMGYAIAALLYVYARPRQLIFIAAAGLVGYWAILALVPVFGSARGSYTEIGNVANYVDRLILGPKQMYEPYGDPEGLLSTIPAVATALLGLFAGLWLKSERPDRQKIQGLVIGGLALVAVGLLWAPIFPVIKKIWSSSYMLVAGGCSAMLLGIAYWLVDVKGYRKLALPLIVIGMNAITIYLLKEVVNFGSVADYFVGGFASRAPLYKEFVLASGAVVAEWLVLYFLYRKRVFLRV